MSSEKLALLPRPRIMESWLLALRLAAAKRGVMETDLIREAIESHPDILREAEQMGLEPMNITRGGWRRD